MAVNYAVRGIFADWIFTFHPELAQVFRALSWNQEALVHCCVHNGSRGLDHYPNVNVWWPRLAAGGGSSWGAARVALHMGYTEVIFAGVPLDPNGGYAWPVPGPSVPNWSLSGRGEANATSMARHMRHEAAGPFGRQVWSMGGATAIIFGYPPRMTGEMHGDATNGDNQRHRL